MTYLPKSELVGVLAPYSMFPSDIGLLWIDLGAIAVNPIQAASYLGNGIAIIGITQNVWRSVDYGQTWVDLGIISGGTILSSAYFGNGIAIIGDSDGHIFRSTDFGVNWTDLGPIGGAHFMYSPISVGRGRGFIFTTESKLFVTTTYGATWVDVFQNFGGQIVGVAASNLGNGIVLVGSSLGHIWRTTNYGTIWTDLGLITDASIVEYMSYLGNGIVIICSQAGNIYRSVDYGLNWAFIVNIGAVPGTLASYLGNGISIICSNDGHVWRSINFGVSWTDLGNLFGVNYPWFHLYLGNGVVIAGSANHIFRSDVSYKLDESQVNYPRIISGDLGPLGTNTRLIDTVVPGTNIYTNNDKTRTLIVSVGCTCITPAALDGAAFDIEADSAATPITLVSPTVGISTGLLGEQNIFMATGYVGPGLNYRVNQLIAGTGVVTLDKWFEMYI